VLLDDLFLLPSLSWDSRDEHECFVQLLSSDDKKIICGVQGIFSDQIVIECCLTIYSYSRPSRGIHVTNMNSTVTKSLRFLKHPSPIAKPSMWVLP
jgi:hypothetical protein